MLSASNSLRMAAKQSNVRFEVVGTIVPTRFPPVGVPMYKCVDIWLDNADSMFGAIERAWEQYDSSKLARLYETKPKVLAEIVRDGGGNRYRLPHWRDKE